MEARNRAIASKSRASSPAPHANGRSHRRDRSSGPAETRFPIQTSPTTVPEGQRKAAVRASLEVPASQTSSPVAEKQSSAPISNSHMHSSNRNSIPEDDVPRKESAASYQEDGGRSAIVPEGVNGGFAEKRESLTRATRYPQRKNIARGSLGDEGMRPMVGVQLSDKPMDD